MLQSSGKWWAADVVIAVQHHSKCFCTVNRRSIFRKGWPQDKWNMLPPAGHMSCRFFLNGDGKIWGPSVILTDCILHPDHLVAMSILIGSCRRQVASSKIRKKQQQTHLKHLITRKQAGTRGTWKPHYTRMIHAPPWKLVRLGACWLVDQLAPACWLVDQLAPGCWLVDHWAPACWLVDQLAPACWLVDHRAPACGLVDHPSSRVSTSGIN